MTAAQRRLKAWAKMTSKQKLADMEKEDRRRKKVLRVGGSAHFPYFIPANRQATARRLTALPAAQPLYHEKP